MRIAVKASTLVTAIGVGARNQLRSAAPMDWASDVDRNTMMNAKIQVSPLAITNDTKTTSSDGVCITDTVGVDGHTMWVWM